MKCSQGRDFTLEKRKLGTLNLSIFKVLTPRAEIEYGDEMGTYTTLTGDIKFDDKTARIVSDVLEEALYDFIEESNKPFEEFLTVGLGNDASIADSLGPKTCDTLTEIYSQVKTFKPSVFCKTGVISADAVAQKTKEIKQTHTILIDSMVCIKPNELYSLQIATGNGIAPGSEVDKSKYIMMIERFFEDYYENKIDDKHQNEFLNELNLKNINELRSYLAKLKYANKFDTNKLIHSKRLRIPILSIQVPTVLKSETDFSRGVKQTMVTCESKDISNLATFNIQGNFVVPDLNKSRDAISFYSKNIGETIDKVDRNIHDNRLFTVLDDRVFA